MILKDRIENERIKNARKQKKAEEAGGIFWGFCGEGNEFFLEDMEGEELSGWLIPIEKSNIFEEEWKKSKSIDDLERWMDYYTWVLWKNNDGNIKIEFRKY